MSGTIEVRVPDIGDFKDVPVIEVLVKAGDTVKKNDSLVTLESEKASMEVPSAADGVVQDGDGQSRRQSLARDRRYVRWLSGTRRRKLRRTRRPETPRRCNAKAKSIEVRVPDIGDFKDVPVIEVLVKAGDRVENDTTRSITLESEKASMEVPVEADGVVQTST